MHPNTGIRGNTGAGQSFVRILVCKQNYRCALHARVSLAKGKYLLPGGSMVITQRIDPSDDFGGRWRKMKGGGGKEVGSWREGRAASGEFGYSGRTGDHSGKLR